MANNSLSHGGSQQGSQQKASAANQFDTILGRLMEAVGAKSETDLGKALGIKQPSISAAKKRGQIPPSWVEAIAKNHGCSADWLFFGEGAKRRGGAAPAETPPIHVASKYKDAAGDFGLVLVPKVRARLSAGTGSLETDGDIKGFYAFREEWLTLRGTPGAMVLMDVVGDSMSPVIEAGDTVLVDESKKDIFAGGIYAVGIDDEVVVKYVDKQPGKLILRSKNYEEYPPIEVDLRNEAQHVRIIGRIVWWCREAR